VEREAAARGTFAFSPWAGIALNHSRSMQTETTNQRPSRPEGARPKRANLFVYGTLMDDANVKALTGRTYPKEPGILWNFERIVPNKGYPYILPKHGGSVSGYVLKGLSQDALYRIDEYESEGNLYVRQ